MYPASVSLKEELLSSIQRIFNGRAPTYKFSKRKACIIKIFMPIIIKSASSMPHSWCCWYE